MLPPPPIAPSKKRPVSHLSTSLASQRSPAQLFTQHTKKDNNSPYKQPVNPALVISPPFKGLIPAADIIHITASHPEYNRWTNPRFWANQVVMLPDRYKDPQQHEQLMKGLNKLKARTINHYSTAASIILIQGEEQNKRWKPEQDDAVSNYANPRNTSSVTVNNAGRVSQSPIGSTSSSSLSLRARGSSLIQKAQAASTLNSGITAIVMPPALSSVTPPSPSASLSLLLRRNAAGAGQVVFSVKSFLSVLPILLSSTASSIDAEHEHVHTDSPYPTLIIESISGYYAPLISTFPPHPTTGAPSHPQIWLTSPPGQSPFVPPKHCEKEKKSAVFPFSHRRVAPRDPTLPSPSFTPKYVFPSTPHYCEVCRMTFVGEVKKHLDTTKHKECARNQVGWKRLLDLQAMTRIKTYQFNKNWFSEEESRVLNSWRDPINPNHNRVSVSPSGLCMRYNDAPPPDKNVLNCYADEQVWCSPTELHGKLVYQHHELHSVPAEYIYEDIHNGLYRQRVYPKEAIEKRRQGVEQEKTTTEKQKQATEDQQSQCDAVENLIVPRSTRSRPGRLNNDQLLQWLPHKYHRELEIDFRKQDSIVSAEKQENGTRRSQRVKKRKTE